MNRLKLFLAAAVLTALFVFLCRTPQISDSELSGKSREEIVKILFEKSERTKTGEARIAVITPKGGMDSHYFAKPSDLENSADIMRAPVWRCFFHKHFFSLSGKVSYREIEFKDGKAASAKLKHYNDSI